MTNGTGLSGWPTASDVYKDVKLVRCLRQIQRLSNNHPQRLVRKIRFEGFPVDLNIAAAWPQINAGRRSLSASRSVIFNICHVLNRFLILFLIFAGREVEVLWLLRRVRMLGVSIDF